MRSAYLLLLVTTPLVGGCSGMIASSGRDLRCMDTKAEVRARMGEPSKSGVEEGKAFDEYHTRRKISEAGTAQMASWGMGFVMTFGISQLVAFPRELYYVGSRTVVGRDVRFVYDPEDKVIDRHLDGVSIFYLSGVKRHFVEPQPAASENGSSSPPPCPPPP